MPSKESYQEILLENKKLREEVSELRTRLDQTMTHREGHTTLEQLEFLLDNAPLGVIEWDARQRVSGFSKGAEKIFGWKAHEVIGKHYSEWHHIYEEDSHILDETVQQYIEQQRPGISVLVRNYCKDGKLIWCEWHDSNFYDDTGKMTWVISFVRDVTARVEAELALKNSEELFRTFMALLPVDVYIKNQDLSYIFANQNLLSEYKTTLDEYLHTRFSDHFDAATAKHVEDADRQVLSGEKPLIDMEYLGERKGKKIWLRDIKFPITWKDGVSAVGGIAIDISTMKNAQIKLQESEAKLREAEAWFRTTLYSIGDAVITTDAQGKIRQMNPVAEELTGWRETDANGRPLEEIFCIFNEQTQQPVENPIRRVISEGTVVGLANHTVLRSRDGNERPIVDSAAPIRSGQGEIIGAVLVFRDQTAERTAQKTLEASEERYRTLSELISDFAYAFSIGEDGSLTVEWVAGASERITGYTIDDMSTGENWGKLFYEEDLPVFQKLMAEFLQGKQMIHEFRARTKSGDACWLRAYGQPIWNEDHSRMIRIIGGVQDITSRKLAEEALRVGEERYRLLFNNVADAVFFHDEQGYLIDFNDAACRRLEYSREELQGKHLNTFIVQESADKLIERMDTIKSTGSLIFESAHRTRSGEVIPVETSVRLVNDGDEKRFLSVSRDIRERKRAEKAIKDNERLLRNIIDSLPESIFVKDHNLRMLVCNNVFASAVKKTPAEMVGKTDIENGWAPEFARKFEKYDRIALSGENVFVSDDPGSEGERIYETIKMPFRDDAGQIMGVLGIARDITEKKKIEEVLRASEQRYRSLFNSMHNGFILHEMIYDEESKPVDFRYLEINPAIEDLLGVKPEELLGKTVRERQPETASYWIEKFANIEKTGKALVAEEKFNGKYFEFVAYSPQEGQFAVLFTDITVRKQAEDVLRASEQRYRTLFNSMNNSFALHQIILDDDGKPIDAIYLEVNPAYEALTGIKAEAVIGKSMFGPKPGWEVSWLDTYARVALTGEPGYYEDYAPSLGKYFDFVIYSPQKGQFAIVYNDISERVRTRKALEESEERYRALIESAPISIAVMQDGKYAYANHYAALLHGLDDPQQVIGKPTLLGIPSRYHAVISERLQKNTRDLPNPPIEFEIEGQDGVTRNIQTISRAIVLGEKPAFLIIGQDITERKLIESSLRATEKLASVGTLAAGVAHEINTPLQVITGLSRRLIEHTKMERLDAEKMRKDLENLEQNSWRVARIVRSLLSYSRVSMDEVARNNLNDIVRDTLVLTEHQLSSWSNIRIRTDLQRDLPEVYCERNSIIQVLINLMNNARDAMPAGGEINLRTRFAPSNRQFTLYVSDTGTGISEGDLRHVFDPFFTTKKVGEGTGLGLSVVRSIVESHGGTISIRSSSEEGTTFIITLPEIPPLMEKGSEDLTGEKTTGEQGV